MKPSRALFLDRDGVINIDHGYVYLRDQFEFVDGIFDLCREAQARGYLLILVTNQAGIGRGFYSECDFYQLTDWMCGEFLRREIRIDKIYFCPYHPEHGMGSYKKESAFRKPAPGMILAAADELGLDLAASILIGDKDIDIEAGLAAGVGSTVLYRPTGDGEIVCNPSYVIRNLRDAKQLLD